MNLHIAHLSVARGFPGLLKQLQYEYRSAAEMGHVEWIPIAFTTDECDEPFALRCPPGFSGVFSQKLFAWLWLLKHARRYDYVLVRHMTFDPFAVIFAWFVRNRVLVHHSKEVEELPYIRRGWKGRAAALLERFSGRVAVRTAAGILGVTEEIRKYEVEFHGLPEDFPSYVYPNGICVDDIALLDDRRSKNEIEIGFLCGTFSAWHGLDIILDQLESDEARGSLPEPMTLHLIGQLDYVQERQVKRIQERGGLCRISDHGVMDAANYEPILARCHVGLGSLAMARTGLKEASTLKVREMLAMGLIVYSGHKDTALPENFPSYFEGTGELLEIVTFARRCSDVPRFNVREGARPYIEKVGYMRSVGVFLRQIQNS